MAPKTFLEAVQTRRTIYALNKDVPISDKQITEIAKQIVLHVPSSFNSQSTRIVVLLGREHDTFWDYVLEVLKPMLPAEQFPSTEQRVSGFKAGYGTALFLEDPEPVEALRKGFPIFAHHFGDWSEHTSAMHQFALWTALEAEGLGASLQHYNPIIDIKAQEHWNIPVDWKLRSQLVFGGKVADAGEKEFKPVEGTRLFVHGAKE
ncbi:putative nitroreductase [Neocucurbitaria cava]|uniref:Nitroreductase n=1 Tax=Neocucurbitaria cava TaxID=798079 RepID=A0A9W8Y0I2_9PLEO|nr:putative nitroreductase [Neocucurbitaria cava]